MTSCAHADVVRGFTTVRLLFVTTVGLLAALVPVNLARADAFSEQYQINNLAVSSGVFAPVSPARDAGIFFSGFASNELDMRRKGVIRRQSYLPLQIAAGQYQAPESEREDQRLMLRIALGLGLAYVVFLACWIWATRLRSRPPRH